MCLFSLTWDENIKSISRTQDLRLRRASSLFACIAPTFAQLSISGQLPQVSTPLPTAHCLIGQIESQ